jgi:hypothetical protein
MDLRPCECGESAFARNSTVVALSDGTLANHYSGACDRCGRPREFLFRLPDEVTMPPADGRISYGGAEPSQLLDPGEWLWVADAYAALAPADPATAGPEQRRRARAALNRAAAALDEAVKFIPAGSDEVPASAVTSERGRAILGRQPGGLRRPRLVAARDAYAGLADRLA